MDEYFSKLPKILKKALDDKLTSFESVKDDIEICFEPVKLYRIIFRDDLSLCEADFKSQAERFIEYGDKPKLPRGMNFNEMSFLADIGNYSCSFNDNASALSNAMNLRRKPERHLSVGVINQDNGFIKRKNEQNGHVHCWIYNGQIAEIIKVFKVLNKDDEVRFYN